MRLWSMSTYKDSLHLHGKLFGLSKVASTLILRIKGLLYVAPQIISYSRKRKIIARFI